MIATETIPNAVTWEEIKAHCHRDDNEEQAYLVGLGLACTEAFEKETNYAAKSRSVVIGYDAEDFTTGCRTCRRSFTSYRLEVPKGPVASITSVVANGVTLDASAYKLSKVGTKFFVDLSVSPQSLTVTLDVGTTVVPQLIKQAVLLHVETLRANRGAVTNQQQYTLSVGLERVYDLYRTYKVVAK